MFGSASADARFCALMCCQAPHGKERRGEYVRGPPASEAEAPERAAWGVQPGQRQGLSVTVAKAEVPSAANAAVSVCNLYHPRL